MILDRPSFERLLLSHAWIRSIDVFAYIGFGWVQILDGMLKSLDPIIAQHPGIEARGVYIKEKFGGLRVHLNLNGASNEVFFQVRPIVEEAETLSLQTCEVCGRAGTLRNQAGWFSVRCDAHAGFGS